MFTVAARRALALPKSARLAAGAVQENNGPAVDLEPAPFGGVELPSSGSAIDQAGGARYRTCRPVQGVLPIAFSHRACFLQKALNVFSRGAKAAAIGLAGCLYAG